MTVYETLYRLSYLNSADETEAREFIASHVVTLNGQRLAYRLDVSRILRPGDTLAVDTVSHLIKWDKV